MHFFRIIVFTLLFNQRGSQSLKILVSAGIKLIMIFSPAKISTSDQHWFNVVDQRWFNVLTNLEITLIRRWKWNKIRRRIFNVVQRWYNVRVRRWNNVEPTLRNVYTTVFFDVTQRFLNAFSRLKWHCLNIVSIWPKLQLNPYWNQSG